MIDRTLLVALREVFAERRHPDGLVAALTFTGMVVLLESLALGPGRARQPDVASGIFWIAILFSATLVSQRSFDRDLEDDAIDAVLALPGGRDAIYAGKVVALGMITGLVAVAAGVMALLLLSLEIALPLHLVLLLALGIVALAPVIVLVHVLALRVRARVAVVPIIAFPVLTPQLVAATQGTAAAISGDATAAMGWAGLLAAFALVYTVLGVTIVPTAIE